MPSVTLTPITKRPQSIPDGMRWCPSHNNKQGAVLPVASFSKHSGRASGIYWCCKDCDRANRPKVITPQSRYQQVKKRARNREKDFAITLEQFQAITAQPCAYGDARSPQSTIGIDREDNSQGYVEGNCLPCCYRHNYIKGSVFTYEEMLDICQRYPSAKACGDPPQYKTRKAI